MPWVVVGLWLAALVLTGPLAGKFGEVQQNRAADHLPDSADSAQAARIQAQLPGGEATEPVLVHHRDAALTALRTTGGVIASAGVVLAATFAVLTTLPLVGMVEPGFVIAVGVLLDTFLVRTCPVTTASVLLRRRMWWPGRLSRPAAKPVREEKGEREPEPVQ